MRNLIVALNDNSTFTPLEGCYIACLTDEQQLESDLTSEIPNPEDCDHLMIGPVESTDQIFKWMRIFFPNMRVEEDDDGQVVIHTGVYE